MFFTILNLFSINIRASLHFFVFDKKLSKSDNIFLYYLKLSFYTSYPQIFFESNCFVCINNPPLSSIWIDLGYNERLPVIEPVSIQRFPL